MNHYDHVNLIKNGVHPQNGVWADFGSGRGAFTLALADVLTPHAKIYSLDRDWFSLQQQKRAMRKQFPSMQVQFQRADFTQRQKLPSLDGILMANALHFVPDKGKAAVLAHLHSYLRPNGRLIMIEYNVDRGNRWVPYPFSFQTWHRLAAESGFGETQLLATRPSRFLREIYSAVSVVGAGS